MPLMINGQKTGSGLIIMRSAASLVFIGLLAFLSQRNLFNYFKSRLSRVQRGVLNKVVRSRCRLNSVVYNVRFLEDCLENFVAPKRIQRRVKKSKVYHSAVIERAFVRDELGKSRRTLQEARKDFQQLYREARRFLSYFDFFRFSWLLSECDRKQRASLVLKNCESIGRLRQERFGSRQNDYATIINLTDIELTTLQKEVLCRGVNFGVPPKIAEPDVLAEFELLHRQAAEFVPVSKEAAERSRCELAALAREFASTKPDTRHFSLQREHRKTIVDLRKNQNLVITRPDKGRATVILTRQDYVDKMMAILRDQSKFLSLGPVSQFDRTAKIEQCLREYLKTLFDSGEIPECVYKTIFPVGSSRPRMYGLPKIHKLDVPLRPILSMCGSSQYNISKWLCEHLKPVVQYYGERCVRDSFMFSDAVRTKGLSRNGYMCSFDVVSLFTNVPLEEVIDICADALYRNGNIETELTTLTEDSFRKLMKLVTSDVEFSFNDVMYRQTDGVAMGSPLGPTLANIFVGYCEKKIPDEEWPEMYSRYVDDVFSHFRSQEESIMFHKRLNSLHPSLRFTVEGEEDGSLPFLEVKVTRTEAGMVTSIYRKPTFTGLYIPWDSYSATIYKTNLVRALTSRILRICSPSVIENELSILRGIFLKNGYPGQVLDRLITRNVPARKIGPKLCPIVIRLPWLGGRTENLVQRTNHAVRLAYYAAKVRAIYQTNHAFRLPKDKLPTPSVSNVIYLFECRHCEGRYVGKTAQRLGERIKQHVPRHLIDSAFGAEPPKRRGRPPKKRDNLGDGYQSAIACHLASNKQCRELYQETDFKILSRGRSKYHLDVLEAVYISVLNPVLCKQKMSVTYLQLFQHAHTSKQS